MSKGGFYCLALFFSFNLFASQQQEEPLILEKIKPLIFEKQLPRNKEHYAIILRAFVLHAPDEEFIDLISWLKTATANIGYFIKALNRLESSRIKKISNSTQYRHTDHPLWLPVINIPDKNENQGVILNIKKEQARVAIRGYMRWHYLYKALENDRISTFFCLSTFWDISFVKARLKMTLAIVELKKHGWILDPKNFLLKQNNN